MSKLAKKGSLYTLVDEAGPFEYGCIGFLIIIVYFIMSNVSVLLE